MSVPNSKIKGFIFFCWLLVCPQIAAAQIEKNAVRSAHSPLAFIERDDGLIQETVKLSDLPRRFEARDTEPDFSLETVKKQSKFGDWASDDTKKTLTRTKESSDDDQRKVIESKGFQWRPAIAQSLMFLAVQHGYALALQQKTRDALKGKFFKDYIRSVKSLRGWDDGGKFFTNYIAHPMQGALTGFIYVQNSPREKSLEYGDKGYWKSRAKAFVWSAAWSTQWELGPISQASIGNIGLKGHQAYVDLVITPVAGTALMIAEDAIDRFIIKRIERRTNNFYVRVFTRLFLNPNRNFANLLRFKEPWKRERPIAR
jgi:hypothetical protein